MTKFRITKRENRIEQIVQALPAKADQALRALGSEIVSDIKLSFGDSPDGREYWRGSVLHIASVEGYPPNVDIGTLRASIRLMPDGKLRYLVVDGVEYGLPLEEGTENMGPRPFMGPAFEARRGDLPQFLRDIGLV